MIFFKRKLYDWHNKKRDSLAITPGGPTKNGKKLIAYHEKQMLKLAEEK